MKDVILFMGKVTRLAYKEGHLELFKNFDFYRGCFVILCSVAKAVSYMTIICSK